MVINGFDTCLSENSVFSHRRIVNPHFIAMSVIESSNGRYCIDQLHPFHPTSDIQEELIETRAVVNT